MPIKINWTHGKYLGTALLLFGVMGLVQALIFIPIGQYVINVGSVYVVILLPIGVTIAMMYSAQVLYESYLQSKIGRRGSYKGENRRGFAGLEPEIIKSILMAVISFTIFFFAALGIAGSDMAPINRFVISENVASIGTLIVASIVESQLNPTRK